MSVKFRLNGRDVTASAITPTTTTLEWLRARGMSGTKEGCAEGDCGACSIAIRAPAGRGRSAWRSVCSCILPVASLDGQDVVTVEGLSADGSLHPAQASMVEALGSQCGYCTPGFVMSLFEGTYRTDLSDQGRKDDQICGNLCRCTGYRPIRDALDAVAGTCPVDSFSRACAGPAPRLASVQVVAGDQRFLRPTSWDALWTAISASDSPPRYVHGATDLGLNITKRRETWPLLVDLAALPGMDTLERDEDGCTIGAGVRLSDLEAWSADNLPVLARMLRYFASRQIKNRATVGGNICNASPIGDLPPVLLALDAQVRIRGPESDRIVAMDDFYTGYRATVLAPEEVVVEFYIPALPAGARAGAFKVSKRRELDISAVSAAMVVATDEQGFVLHARVAYGGMAATPARASAVEASLRNRRWESGTVEDACRALARDFSPIDDHRATAWYRATVAANLLRGFLLETLAPEDPVLPERHTATVVEGGQP